MIESVKLKLIGILSMVAYSLQWMSNIHIWSFGISDHFWTVSIWKHFSMVDTCWALKANRPSLHQVGSISRFVQCDSPRRWRAWCHSQAVRKTVSALISWVFGTFGILCWWLLVFNFNQPRTFGFYFLFITLSLLLLSLLCRRIAGLGLIMNGRLSANQSETALIGLFHLFLLLVEVFNLGSGKLKEVPAAELWSLPFVISLIGSWMGSRLELGRLCSTGNHLGISIWIQEVLSTHELTYSCRIERDLATRALT